MMWMCSNTSQETTLIVSWPNNLIRMRYSELKFQKNYKKCDFYSTLSPDSGQSSRPITPFFSIILIYAAKAFQPYIIRVISSRNEAATRPQSWRFRTVGLGFQRKKKTRPAPSPLAASAREARALPSVVVSGWGRRVWVPPKSYYFSKIVN